MDEAYIKAFLGVALALLWKPTPSRERWDDGGGQALVCLVYLVLVSVLTYRIWPLLP